MELRATWNGVTGHVVGLPDLGQVLDPTMQRVKHLALKEITDSRETPEDPVIP